MAVAVRVDAVGAVAVVVHAVPNDVVDAGVDRGIGVVAVLQVPVLGVVGDVRRVPVAVDVDAVPAIAVVVDAVAVGVIGAGMDGRVVGGAVQRVGVSVSVGVGVTGRAAATQRKGE